MQKRTLNIPESQDTLPLTQAHWQQMQEVLENGEEFCKMQLAPRLEFRFVPMEDNSYSALLSYNNLDVFHFMWTETQGLVYITHRIVNPKWRGQGIGTEAMFVVERRLQHQVNRTRQPSTLVIETSQLSVVNLGLKREMTLTRGQDIFQAVQQQDPRFTMADNTHVLLNGKYPVEFRVSKVVRPLTAEIVNFQDQVRRATVNVLIRQAA